MPLSDEFRHQELIAKTRHVRTPAGSRFFHLPIGAPITAEAMAAAKAEHGHMATSRMLRAEHGAGPGVGTAVPDMPITNRMRSFTTKTRKAV